MSAGMMWGLRWGLGWRLIWGLGSGLFWGLIFFGVGFGASVGRHKVEAFKIFDTSFSRFGRKDFFLELTKSLILGLGGWLVLALISGAILEPIGNPTISPIERLVSALICGSIHSLQVGLVSALSQDIAIRVQPNQGILQARNYALLFTGEVIAIALLLNFILEPFIAQRINNVVLAEGFIYSIQFCLIPWLILTTGGLACIQHLALRLVLWRTGQIPWNYARFLNHCTDRLLLQRVGGGYRFIHKRLQDHFAELPFEP
ncbi:MAG: hypothetical protein HC857_17245 [Synechococcales cyanobacterium RU_4_20]|nr:hypothetical protein [Synechococcales cyanobacterium RU_4_20]